MVNQHGFLDKSYLLTKSIASFICIFFLLLNSEELRAQMPTDYYMPHKEIRISSPAMNCDYRMEDIFQMRFNFEFPKLFISEDNKLTIAFVDEGSKRLFFANIIDQNVSIVNSIPSFGDDVWRKWLIVFIRNNNLYLAVISQLYSGRKRDYEVRLFSLEKDSSLKLQRNIILKNGVIWHELNDKSASLSGVYQFDEHKDRFLIVGRFNDSYFDLRAIYSGHFPKFAKIFSLILDDNTISGFDLIEEKGQFGIKNQVYTVSESGIVHAAWIRDTSCIGFSQKHNETICYSQNNNGTGWAKPLELHTLNEIETISSIRQLALANDKHSAFILWQEIEKGFYFMEIKDGKQKEVVKIADIPKHIRPLYDSSSGKITSDYFGNVYVLWVWNSGFQSYQMFLKTRINGKWTDTVVVNIGVGNIMWPNMQVDKKGVVHVAYAKGPKDKLACYYMKIEPKPLLLQR